MKDLSGKTICVLGSHGFIGSSLSDEIKKRGGTVVTTPTKDSHAVLHFASYTHIPFESNPAYHTHEIVTSFLYFLPFCQEHHIPFIYPSSALIYEKERPFYHLKKTLEELTQIYQTRSLGLRIFPVYGAGEGNRGHTTVIYQWIKQMLTGERPVVFGDGTQSRDFIYVSDVVDTILDFMDSDISGIRDVGRGEKVSFNEIISIINKELGTHLVPEYRPVPENYTAGVVCQNPVPTKVDIREGIKRIIVELKGE